MKVESKQGEFKPIGILLEGQEDLDFMLALAKGGIVHPWDPIVSKAKNFYNQLMKVQDEN